ncbi:MAG: exodeoxyribonuclease VII small subunit [Desulfobulbus propionicus]|nr:MAG: exodeoxyribonuclease VII small subunit [Desulfobulbus propionicus]
MAKKTFESALAKLEQITEELEAGELPLETSLKKFDEGINLVNFCNNKLDEAKTKVDILLRQEDNSYKTEPFPEESLGD